MGRTIVTAEEFAGRRERLRQAVAGAGVNAALVVSRGGGSLDRYADVFWATGFYTQFPYIPDVAANWSGRAHAVLVLPAEGEPRLIVDIAVSGVAGLPKSQVRFADFVTEAAIETVREMGLAGASLGLIGAEAMPASMYRAIEAGLPGTTFRDIQPLANALRAVKSPAEIELLRRASDLGSRMTDAMMGAARPGRTHGEIMAAGLDVLVPAGGMLYNAFLRSGRGGENARLVKSALPTWGSGERLEAGDFFCAGVSGILDGYYFDLARSCPVGRVSNAQIDVFESTIGVVEAGIRAVRAGVTGGAVMAAGAAEQARLGFARTGNFQGFGHGIGLGWDDPWLAPGVETPIAPDMVICVEKWLMRDGHAGDLEETVVVTPSGPEKITDARVRWW
jgi:Xaa-Pro aminopeptidase